MDGGLSGRGIEAVADGLPIQRNDFAFGVGMQTLGETQKAAPELFGIEPGKQATEGIIRRDAVGKFQAKPLLEPVLFGLPEVFHVLPAFGSAQNGAEGDHHDVQQCVLLSAIKARVLEEGEM